MYEVLFILFQYVVPKKLISKMIGVLARSEIVFIKNTFIKTFQMMYDVNMQEACNEDGSSYPSFNSFFVRSLKPECRPIDKNINSVISPVDGSVSQLGNVKSGKLIQAKGMYFNLLEFLGNNKPIYEKMKEGMFSTFYLSPKDYHRVHMPLDGKLREMIYLPGKLFSVNSTTSKRVKNLYSKNERLVCIFDTVRGPMVVVLVGAMIVSGITVNWEDENIFNKGKIQKLMYPTIGKGSVSLKKGDEVGRFMLGSTVVVCFGMNKIHWEDEISIGSVIKMGQSVGYF
tara:strand:+ start:432 stop:1286 length:855 start_codon:yes stop_codon:yes gene_type:complete